MCVKILKKYKNNYIYSYFYNINYIIKGAHILESMIKV